MGRRGKKLGDMKRRRRKEGRRKKKIGDRKEEEGMKGRIGTG